MTDTISQVGSYPSTDGYTCEQSGFVVVTVSHHVVGSSPAVEISKDEGQTWERQPYMCGKFKRNHIWGFTRSYVVQSGWRVRLVVSRYSNQFNLWMSTRL